MNETTGEVDREKEEYYWEQIREKSRFMEELRRKSVTELARVIPDYAGLRDFLRELPEKWETFSRYIRNRFLKALIERVELKGGENKIEVTITWKAGFRQQVLISRWGSKAFREKLWTAEEDKQLAEMFSSTSQENILKSFPVRSWKAITLRAKRLNIRRSRRIVLKQEQLLVRNEKKNQTPPLGYQNLKLHQEFPSGR